MVSVSSDETAEEAGAFAREVRATFPVLVDPKGNVWGKFGMQAQPSNVVVNRSGKVVFSAEGEVDLKALEAAVSKAVGR